MIGLTWIGWDGSRWDLNSGPVRAVAGVSELFNMGPVETFTRVSPQTDGQTRTGHRQESRIGLLPVLLHESGSVGEWLVLERAFRRTLRPDRMGTLVAQAPDGSERRLRLRVEGDGDEVDVDPSVRMHSVAPLRVIADDPWWAGPIIERDFRNGSAPVNFYGGETDRATPFVLGSANTTVAATLTNPGDADAWATHILTGPLDSWFIRLNGGVLRNRAVIAANEVVVIETAPTRKVAWLYGPDGAERVTRSHLASWGFAPVPEGATVPLDVELSGAGSLTVLTTPRYRRAVT